jgi:hypothetical protein
MFVRTGELFHNNEQQFIATIEFLPCSYIKYQSSSIIYKESKRVAPGAWRQIERLY